MESCFLTLAQMISSGVLIVRRQPTGGDFLIEACNAVFSKKVGMDENDLVGRPLAEVLPGWVENGMLERISQAARSKSLQQFSSFRQTDLTSLNWQEALIQSSLAGEIVILLNEVPAENPYDLSRHESHLKPDSERKSSQGIYQIQVDGKIIHVNSVFARMFGYDSSAQLKTEIEKMDQRLYVYAEQQEELSDRLQKDGEFSVDEVSFRRKDGSTFIASLNQWIVRREDGSPEFIEGFIEDVTESVQRRHEMEVVTSVSHVLRSAANQTEIIEAVMDQMNEILGDDGSTLAVVDPISHHLKTVAGRGILSSAVGIDLKPGEGRSGWVVQTGRFFLKNDMDVDRDDMMVNLHLVKGLKSVLMVPMLVDGKAIGVLSIARQREITRQDVQLLQAVADIAAIAINRTSLNEQTHRRLQKLSALRVIDRTIAANLDISLTLHIFLEQVVNQLEVDAADVMLLNPNIQQLNFAAGIGFEEQSLIETSLRVGEGLAGRAALELHPVVEHDLASVSDTGMRTQWLKKEKFIYYQAMPLIARGQVKGVLEVFSRSPLNPDAEWMDFLESLTSQAAILFDSKELFDALQRSNLELKLAQSATLDGWVKSIDHRNHETEGHTQRIAESTLRLASLMGITDERLNMLYRGALLHDVGRLAIPESILLKPGPLTPGEWNVVRQYPDYAFQLLNPINFLQSAAVIPYCLQERWDGSGYPRGIKGTEIPLAARIFSVINVFETLLSPRSYRAAWGRQAALDYMREQAGIHFDPGVVAAFLDSMGEERLIPNSAAI